MGTGRLTTHVLDTARGQPAAGMTVELWRLAPPDAHLRHVHLRTVLTNADGRIDGPVCDGDEFVAGHYELRFMAADYQRDLGEDLAEPAFLEVVAVRFGIADPSRHYHVPLLLSPYGYSTYRGS